jgi:hypothetical protein
MKITPNRAFALLAGWVILCLSVPAAVAYIAIHFIRKFW